VTDLQDSKNRVRLTILLRLQAYCQHVFAYRWWLQQQQCCKNQRRVLMYNMHTLDQHWLNLRPLSHTVKTTAHDNSCSTLSFSGWFVGMLRRFFLVCLRAEAHTSLTWKGFQKHKQIVFLHSILNFHRLNLQVHVKFYPIHSFRTIFPSSEWKSFVNFLECDPGVPFSSLFSVVRPCWKCGVSLLAKCWPIIWWLIIHAGVQANHFETEWSTDHMSSYNFDHMRSFATLQASAFMKPQNSADMLV